MKKHAKPYSEESYWRRVRDAAADLGTDGCTWGTGLYRDCCLRHDIEWRTGHDIDGDPVTFDQADKRLLACMQSKSRFGYWNPIPWIRYGLVRSIGRKFRPRRKPV